MFFGVPTDGSVCRDGILSHGNLQPAQQHCVGILDGKLTLEGGRGKRGRVLDKKA